MRLRGGISLLAIVIFVALAHKTGDLEKWINMFLESDNIVKAIVIVTALFVLLLAFPKKKSVEV